MLNLIVNDDIVGGLIFPTTVFSQTIDNNNNTQLWTDRGNNARIMFTYDPRNPVIGSPTGLLFNVQDLRTGDQIKNIHARIIITNGQKILKIADVTSSNGDPSINFAFPDSGPYQIIAKIDSKDIAALSSFKVLVPPQALSTGFKSFGMLMLYYVTPITSVAAGIAVYLVYKRPQDKQTPI
jgi:hypothetical protein